MQTFSFEIVAARSPHALPRILLAFARRRLTVNAMSADDVGERLTGVRLNCNCDAFGAGQLLAQLRRIVEVERATAEPIAVNRRA